MATTTRFSPINVGRLPGQVKPCLCEIDPDKNTVRVLARFLGDEELERFKSYEPRVNERRIGGSE